MLTKEKIEEIIKLSLVADTYSLGAHWVYDEKQLKNLPVDWEELNAPQSLWYKGKVAGDFTHIGDQAFWLYKYLQNKDKFIPQEYFKFWQEKMNSCTGYVDGATRETLENIEAGKLRGSNSHDFSVIGRIPPLLLVSKDEVEFLQNVVALVKLSHDNLKELLIQNAKAGGDSSSRSMIVASIVAASRNIDEIPRDWYKINQYIRLNLCKSTIGCCYGNNNRTVC